MEHADVKKIFVSLPMRDKFEDEIRREQNRLLEAAGEYLKEPVKLIETYQTEGKYDALEFLSEAIKRMAGADYVMFGRGWDDARGCKIEMACALQYNKKIVMAGGNICDGRRNLGRQDVKKQEPLLARKPPLWYYVLIILIQTLIAHYLLLCAIITCAYEKIKEV